MTRIQEFNHKTYSLILGSLRVKAYTEYLNDIDKKVNMYD